MRGFTIIELLLIIAILIIVSALAVPFILSSQTSADLATQTYSIVTTLRRAQQQATAGQNSDSWGVYFDIGNHQIILFKGQSYIGRDGSFDLVVDYPASLAVSTDFSDQIYFSQYSGIASASGTVQIINPNNQPATISINSYGKIEISQ